MPIPVGFDVYNPGVTNLIPSQVAIQELQLKKQQQNMQYMNQVLSSIMQYAQQQKGQQFLKDTGVIKEVAQPLTIEDYRKTAQKLGNVDSNVNPALPPDEQLNTAKKLFQGMGWEEPQPQKSTNIDPQKAAQLGVSFGAGGEFTGAKPTENLFQNLVVNEKGEPALNIGGKIVPIGGITKSGFTTPKGGQAGQIVVPQGIQPLPVGANEQQKQQWLSAFDPITAANIKSVGDYTADLSKMSSFFRSGERRTLEGLIKMYRPDWDMKKYYQAQSYLKQLSSASTTSVGGQVNSLNALALHLNELHDSMQNYKGSNLPATTALVQFVQTVLGRPEITDYKTAADVVNSETDRLLTAAAVTQSGAAERRKLLGTPAYQQMEQYVNTLSRIAADRGATLEQQYKTNMGQAPNDEIIYPETREIYNKLIPQRKFISDVNRGMSSTGQGDVAQPQTQAEYDALPSGSIYMDTDGQQKRKK